MKELFSEGEEARPMEEETKITAEEKPTSSLWLVALGIALLGVILGAGIVLALPMLKPKPPPAPKKKYDPMPELLASVNNCETKVDEAKEELNALRLQVGELYERIDTREEQIGTGADRGLRGSLPPPYVRQVDNFFKSPTARNLLSAKVADSSSLRFDRPYFVSQDIITVPYSFGGKYHYLLVKIIILDYYDLQFDVIWDSLEGGE